MESCSHVPENLVGIYNTHRDCILKHFYWLAVNLTANAISEPNFLLGYPYFIICRKWTTLTMG